MMVVLACLAIGFTVLATLTAVVFCMGMGANAKPAQIRALKFWMLVLFLIGAAGVGAGVVLLIGDQPGRAALAGLAPVAVFALIFVVALKRPS